MNLKDLLGDAYQEGMSFDDIQNALQGKNLVDLSTGNYVDVNKHNREVDELNKKLQSKDTELQTKVSNSADSQARIEQLEKELKEQRRESNRNKAVAGVSEAITLLGVKEDDSEYVGFLDNVSELDKNVSNSIISYFSKQVKSAYEKGKADGTKNGLGDMGKQPISSGAKKEDAAGDFGKALAESIIKPNTYDYFNRNK